MGNQEIKVWTVAVGEIRPFAFGRLKKAQDEALELIKKTEGFIGVHPVPGKGTLLLYRTENDAKRAKNQLEYRGCQTGKNIGECFIPLADYENATLNKKE